MWLILFLISLLLGYLTIAFWRKEFSKLEKVFLSFALGMGEISLLMFIIGLLEVPLTAEKVLTTASLLCLFLFFLVFFKTGNPFRIARPRLRRLTISETLLVLTILFLIFWSFTQTINWPIFEWDVLALYDFRAKVMSQTNSLATEIFISQPNLTAYNYVYPFSTSLMHTLIYIGGGSNPKFIYSLFYASLIFLLYACLRRRFSCFQALVLGAVLATTPEILFPSTIAYPNLPYALYFSFSTIYFWEWIKYKKTGFFIVSALFLGFSVWIRNTEPFWIVNIFFVLFFLLREKRFRLAGIYSIIFFPLRQLWPSFQKYIFSIAKDVFYSPPQPFSFDLTKIPEVLFFTIKFFLKDWLGYLFILFLTSVFLWKKSVKNRFILVWLAGYFLLSIAGTYFFAVSFPWWNQIGGSASRISVFFAPLLLYAISTFWPEIERMRDFFTEFVLSLKIDRKKRQLIKWP